MNRSQLTAQALSEYDKDGFVLLKGLFDSEEIDLLRRSAKADKQLDDHSFGRDDGEGGTVRLSLWNHPGQGVYGAFARCNRLASVAEEILQQGTDALVRTVIGKDIDLVARAPCAGVFRRDRIVQDD